jgi:hypothetical protein
MIFLGFLVASVGTISTGNVAATAAIVCGLLCNFNCLCLEKHNARLRRALRSWRTP